MTIGPGGTAEPSATLCSASNDPYSLNLGPQTSGTTYSVDVSILYNSGGFNHTETGKVTGTVQ